MLLSSSSRTTNAASLTITRHSAPLAAGLTDTVHYTINGGPDQTVAFTGNQTTATVTIATSGGASRREVRLVLRATWLGNLCK